MEMQEVLEMYVYRLKKEVHIPLIRLQKQTVVQEVF